MVDHTTLKKGVYISRIDGDITTFDIRVKLPNGGEYLENPAMHTIEHIVATYVRNSEYADNIIYFGPMGCRTGFYLLVRNLDNEKSLSLIKNAFKFVSEYDGEIMGTSAIECGNYLEHDLNKAREEARCYYETIQNKTPQDMNY